MAFGVPINGIFGYHNFPIPLTGGIEIFGGCTAKVPLTIGENLGAHGDIGKFRSPLRDCHLRDTENNLTADLNQITTVGKSDFYIL